MSGSDFAVDHQKESYVIREWRQECNILKFFPDCLKTQQGTRPRLAPPYRKKVNLTRTYATPCPPERNPSVVAQPSTWTLPWTNNHPLLPVKTSTLSSSEQVESTLDLSRVVLGTIPFGLNIKYTTPHPEIRFGD